jgi:hypothetical protein
LTARHRNDQDTDMSKERDHMILGRKDAASVWVRWGISGVYGEDASWAAQQAATAIGPDSEVVVVKGYAAGRDADTGHRGDLPSATEAKVVLRRRAGEIVSGHDLWRAECGGKLVRAYESAAYKAGTGPGPRWRYELLDTSDGAYGLFDSLSGDRVSMILYEAPAESEVVKFGDAEYARRNEPPREPRRREHIR